MADPKLIDPVVPAAEEEEFAKPNPEVNPRNISMAEIAKSRAEATKTEFAETLPATDDDHQPVEPPPAVVEEPASDEPVAEPEADEPAAPVAAEIAPEPGKESIDPAKEYEVTIDGQKMKVPGQKIIDAGFRTFQKETAADYRLQMATDLLRKAEEQTRTTTPQGVVQQAPVATEALSDIDLANAIQYGSQDQAAKAIAEMRNRNTVDPAQIVQLVTAQTRNEIALRDGVQFVQSEYPDLLANDYVKRLFFTEEARYRTPQAQGGLGDTRTHKVIYQEIGDAIRKSLNMPKPATGTTRSSPTAPALAVTAASRQERKAAAPSVPRTAAGRMAANSETPKAKSSSEIIAAMAARRGQGSLTRQLKE
jgi:hypothetical protein